MTRAEPVATGSTAPARPQPWLRVAPYVVVLGLWAVLLPATGAYTNPDGTSYAAVVDRWLAGEWGRAVNGYWSPLLTWLSVPLVALGVPSLLALRVVLLLAALAVPGPLLRLCLRAGASPAAAGWVVLATAPLLAHAASFGLYPDLLAVAALVRCCDLLARPALTSTLTTPLAAGAWGGAAVLAKSYAAPVVLVLVPLAVLLHLLRRPRPRPRALARTVAVALGGVVLVGGPWVAALSAVEGTPTLTTSAGFNARLIAPGSAGNPFNVAGLYEPTHPDSLSAWEEPSRLDVPLRQDAREPSGPTVVEGPSTAVGDVVANAVAQGRIIVGSVARLAAPLAVLGLVGLGLLLRRRQVPPLAVSVTLLGAAVWGGGLLLIIAIQRYTWFPVLALAPVAALGLGLVAGSRPRLLTALGALTVAVMTLTSVVALTPRFGADQDVVAASDRLRAEGGLDGRVAGSRAWSKTLLACFHLDCQYLGRPEATEAGPLAEELAAEDVAWLVVWPEDRADLPFTEDTAAEVGAGADDLLVYEVTGDGLQLDRAVGTGP